MSNKKAYYQGTEEPTPNKKRYKSDPAIVPQSRNKEILYRNYDLYDVPGVDEDKKAVHGPGTGYHGLMEYKSVSDFLKDRRKKLKGKYKAEDEWIQDDGSRTKNPKTSSRLYLLKKIAIDFPIDDSTTPILGESGSYSNSIPVGGQTDNTFLPTDSEGKTKDKLDFGHKSTRLDLDDLTDKYINLSEIDEYPEPQENELSKNLYDSQTKNNNLLNQETSTYDNLPY